MLQKVETKYSHKDKKNRKFVRKQMFTFKRKCAIIQIDDGTLLFLIANRHMKGNNNVERT